MRTPVRNPHEICVCLISRANLSIVFDFVNVALIHNTTIPSSDLLTDEAIFQLRTLADDHEFNLAYNASESIRAIAGSTLAAQIVQQLIDYKLQNLIMPLDKAV